MTNTSARGAGRGSGAGRGQPLSSITTGWERKASKFGRSLNGVLRWVAPELYYDENGNRTTGINSSAYSNATFTTGDHNRLTSDGTFNYEYDAEGNRTRRVRIDNMTPADDYETIYEWDVRNRLVKVTFKELSTATTSEVEFTYDMLNRRIAKQIDSDGDTTVDQTVRYAYDGDHIALQFEGTTTADNAMDLAHRYIFGQQIDQILADERVSSLGTDGDVIWALTDNLGSVRQLAAYDPLMNSTTIENYLEYDSFGNVTREETPAVDHVFGFTGRERDEETGLHFYRARHFDPVVGRFVSEDPIGFEAEDANLVRYVGNGPLVARDPSGNVNPEAIADQKKRVDALKEKKAKGIPIGTDGEKAIRDWEYQIRWLRERGYDAAGHPLAESGGPPQEFQEAFGAFQAGMIMTQTGGGLRPIPHSAPANSPGQAPYHGTPGPKMEDMPVVGSAVTDISANMMWGWGGIAPQKDLSNWGAEAYGNTVNHGYHYITFSVTATSPSANDLADSIYKDLKTFRDFNGRHNSVATVEIENKHNDIFAYFEAKGLLGVGSEIINTPRKVPVQLTYNDKKREISAQTLDRHMLVGVRRWRVLVEGSSVTVETEAYDNPRGWVNEVGMNLMGVDSQLKVWTQYMRNIKESVTSKYGSGIKVVEDAGINGRHEVVPGPNPWKP